MKIRALSIFLLFSILLFSGCEIKPDDIINIENEITSAAETTAPIAAKEPEEKIAEISGKLIVSFLDVGQADSIFIELPNNQTMLIDAGNPQDGNTVIDMIKSKGYQKIDYLVGTHPHADHIGGMASVVNTLDIGTIYMPRIEHTTQTFVNLLTTIENKGYNVKTAKAGVRIIDTKALKADIIAPNADAYKDLNDYSAVIKLTYKDTDFLFCGDAESVSENEMLTFGYDISADVLKVGHHGSNSSSSVSFIKKASPKYAVISCGKDNQYGHPTVEVLNRISSLGTEIYRTDEVGTITITSDGITYAIDKNASVINANAPPSIPKTNTPSTTVKEDKPENASDTVIVYKTRTGAKYHANGCRYLNKSKIETTVQRAKDEGLTPCSVCKPPQ